MTRIVDATLWLTPEAIEDAAVDVLRHAFEDAKRKVTDKVQTFGLTPTRQPMVRLTYEVEVA
jgi:hypothetical protein